MSSPNDVAQNNFDPELFELIPHRPPMLLLNNVVSVSSTEAQSKINIRTSTPFFIKDHGVPAWIGIEYMGQTAALIAGHQLRQGLTTPHLGFLMGVRSFTSNVPYFAADSQLLVQCKESALVGDSLATFDCEISLLTSDDNAVKHQDKNILASGCLSVFRKALSDKLT